MALRELEDAADTLEALRCRRVWLGRAAGEEEGPGSGLAQSSQEAQKRGLAAPAPPC